MPPRSLKTRAAPLERAVARVCREAGARVATNVLLRDLNTGLPAVPSRRSSRRGRRGDERRVEVVANGLPLWGGAQLAVDATLVSAVRRNGTASRQAAQMDGAALHKARARKEATYPELAHTTRCRLVVVGLEVGGRWSDEAAEFIWLLAAARARAAPAALRRSAAQAWQWRWAGVIAVAAQRAFAASLLELPWAGRLGFEDGPDVALADVLHGARAQDPPLPSRLPGW